MPKSGNALVVMAKTPVAGEVKTRLVPPLTLDAAAELYRCLLLDLLDHVAAFEGADLYIACDPPADVSLFQQFAPPAFVCFPQRGDDLGQRMSSIFEDLFEKGYERVVVIGSDLPVFPSTFLDEAFRALSGPSPVVLGPSRDGGYYLIGLSRMLPEIFTGIPWGTEQVLEATGRRLSRIGAEPALVPEWFDVDTAADLEFLKEKKFAAGVQTGTAALLAKLFLRKGAHLF
jgi:rSAM/selenodomain-associated transferase 1